MQHSWLDEPVKKEEEEEEEFTGDAAAPVKFADRVLGVALHHVTGRKKDGYSYSSRLRVERSNPDHKPCGKSRSTTLQTDVLGPLAAQWFLGAWLSRSHVSRKDHRDYEPSLDDIRAFKARSEGGDP